MDRVYTKYAGLVIGLGTLGTEIDGPEGCNWMFSLLFFAANDFLDASNI